MGDNKYAFTWGLEGVRHYTNRESVYFKHLKGVEYSFDGGSVLEVGPGTGKFAVQLINEHNIKKYTVLDIERNIMDSVNYINSKKLNIDLSYIYAERCYEAFDKKFDLLVSNICIPETPKEYRRDLLNNIIPNCKSAMIIGQLKEGRPVGGSGEDYERWIKGLFDKNFKTVKCNLTSYKNCYALIGC